MDRLWNQALRAADDARLLYQAQRHDGACNRAYYAMFNAARALLARHGISPEKMKRHATVSRLFSLTFVKHGPFEAAEGRALANAEQARVKVDYAGGTLDLEAIRDVMESMERFMATAEHVIQGQDPDQGASHD